MSETPDPMAKWRDHAATVEQINAEAPAPITYTDAPVPVSLDLPATTDAAKAARIAERSRLNEIREAHAARWLQWQEDCKRRRAWIDAQRAEYLRRKQARAEAIAAWQKTLEQWDEYVGAAKTDYMNAAHTPAPERPS